MSSDTHIVDLAKLRGQGVHRFDVVPQAGQLKQIQDMLDLLDLRKMRGAAELMPMGRRDWHLKMSWGATVTQPCVVSSEPVTTRLNQQDTRSYLANFEVPQDEEAEMPEDETTEALPEKLDLLAVLTEMITLALPEYPRADAAQLEQTAFAAPGVTPMTDDDAKPFAGLAALRDQMTKNDPE